MPSATPASNRLPSSWLKIVNSSVGKRLRRVWQWLTFVHADDPVRLVLNRGFAAVISVLTLLTPVLALTLLVLGERGGWVTLVAIPIYIFIWWLNRRGTIYGAVLFTLWAILGLVLGSNPSNYAGPRTPIPLIFIFPMLVATLFIRPQAGLWALLLLMAAFGVQLALSDVPRENALRFMIVGTLNLASATIILMAGASIVARALRASIADNAALQRLNTELEQHVVERTRALTKRTEQLETQAADLTQVNDALQKEIAERRQLEDALATERNLLRTLIDLMPDFIYGKDAESRFILGNLAVARIMGASSPEALLGKTDFDFYPAEMAEGFYADEEAIRQSGQPLIDREEFAVNPTTGITRWQSTVKVPLRDSQGKVTGLVGISRDITARKQDEQRMQATSDILRTLNATPDVAAAFPEIAAKLKVITHCERVSLALVDERQEWFQVVALDQPRAELSRSARFRLSETAAAASVLAGHPHLTPDLSTEMSYPVENRLYQAGYRSRLNLPLRLGEQVIGVLNFGWLQPAGYTSVNLQLLGQIAEAISLTVARNQAFETERRQNSYLAALHETTLGLLRRSELNDLLESIVSRAAELVETTHSYIYLVDPASVEPEMELKVGFGHASQYVGLRLKRGEGVAGQVWLTGAPQVVTDYDDWAGRLPAIRRGLYHSVVSVPLTSAARGVIGVMGLGYDRASGRVFGDDEIDLLTRFGQLASVALDNAHLLETERAARRQAETLQKLGSLITSSLDLDNVLNTIAYQVLELMDVSICNLMLLERPDELVWKVKMGAYLDLPPILRHKVGQGLSGWVALHRKPLAVVEMLEDERTMYRDRVEKDHLHSFLGVPMEAKGKLVGVLNILTREPRQFTPEDTDLLVTLAGQAAIAVENAWLFSETQQRAAELEAANRELEAFSYSISHDLRAPLRAMNGFSRLLIEEHAARLDSTAQQYLQRVRDGAQHMSQLIDDLLAFARLSRQPVRKTTVDVASLVQQLLQDLRLESQDRRVDITLGELPACQADLGLLKQVWANLLDNALKYTRGRDIAQIEVGSQSTPEGRVYFVKDNGVGFDMQYADKLFSVFQRLHSDKEFEGTGVGLAIVQRIIQRHGGRVWAGSAVGQGATFYFTL